MRKTYSVNSEWRFKKVSEINRVVPDNYFNMFDFDTKTGVNSDYLGSSYYDGYWETVSLPHDWAVYDTPKPDCENSQGYRMIGEVVYRKSFTLGEEFVNKRLFLKFDAIAIKSKIYVNGILAARSECGYTPIFVEITDFVEPKKQTVIAVVADSSIKEGWWYEGGGIYANAYLICSDESMFADDGIYVRPEHLGGSDWRLNITAEIDGDIRGLKAVFAVDEITTECSFTANKETVSMNIKNPRLWSCDNPELYNMQCRLYKKEKLVDEQAITFGFRTITFDVKNGCLINGKPIKLKGVCIHHDHAGVGVAVPYKLHRYRLEKLKEMGANAVRTSHNPQMKDFYRACDELGFLVMNETRHFSSTEECLEQLRRFVRRDRNHPCVAMWSLFNEEPLQCTKIGYKMAERMKKIVMEEDESRAVTGGMNGPLELEGVRECVDIMGFNYMQYGYEAFHELYPQLPIIGSETGSYLTTRYTAHTNTEKRKICSFENEIGANRYAWSASPGETWKNIEDKSYVLGGFYWTGFDYRGECGEFPSNISSFGAMDLCGFPKECFYMHKAVWDENVNINAVYYRDYKKQGDILINCYTNCKNVALYVDDNLYREYTCSCYETLSVYIDDFCGKKFKFIGNNGEGAFSEFSHEMPVAPYVLDLVASQNILLNDGDDVCVVDVYLKGSNGAIVPTGDSEVNFKVSGGAEIIGVGNGDNTDLTLEKADSKKLYAGCCQLIVRSNGKNEDTVIWAVSEGAVEKEITLPCVPADRKLTVESEKTNLSMLSWYATDVLTEHPYNNLMDMMFFWIPTTVGYGKNLMYSGKTGFGAVAGTLLVPQNVKELKLIFKEITGEFEIYLNKDAVYSGANRKELVIPVNAEKYKEKVVVTVVFKLDGNDCGISGDVYAQA